MKLFRTLAAGIVSLLAASLASAQTIVVIASSQSSKVLTIDATSTSPRVALVQADYVNTPNQRWTLHSAGGGKYYIYNTADGRALEATTTDENAPLYAADLNWEDTHQMWRFAPGYGVADRLITSAFNGLNVTIDAENWQGENAPATQKSNTTQKTTWIVVPVNSVPSCGAFTTALGKVSIGGIPRDDYKNFAITLNQVRNALRVGFWVRNEQDGQDAAVWCEADFLPKWDGWDYNLLISAGTSGSYLVDAYALGADNEWHYLNSTAQVVGQPLPVPRQ